MTQRGNRRQTTFFSDGDYRLYRDFAAEFFSRFKAGVWAYCLAPNHVHLLACPQDAGGLARAMGEVLRRYRREIHFREDWGGFLWKGRFASFPPDDAHALTCARCIELNPVRAGLAKRPEDWRWSSARAHLLGEEDPLLRPSGLLARVRDWRAPLRTGTDAAESIRRHERTGRPLGETGFVKKLERKLHLPLAPRRAGRKKVLDALELVSWPLISIGLTPAELGTLPRSGCLPGRGARG